MSASVVAELCRYGPDSTGPPVSVARARSYCSRLARRHYENFTVASFLLPRRLLRHFHNVYAYCRWADDLADEVGGGQRALELLRWWRGELLRCYEGQARHPVMVALRDTIRQFEIPAQPFLDLLFAFEQDQMVRSYQTFDQLMGYCRFSANPVGHLVLYLCRAYTDDRAVLADFVCTGLQLANFWQDVARDLDIGRVYLPVEDRIRFGYTDEDLHTRRYNSAFRDLMRYEVDRTRELFRCGWPLVNRLDKGVRLDIELFIRGGLAILRRIEAHDYNVWRQRPVLGRWHKAALLGGAVARRLSGLFSS